MDNNISVDINIVTTYAIYNINTNKNVSDKNEGAGISFSNNINLEAF